MPPPIVYWSKVGEGRSESAVIRGAHFPTLCLAERRHGGSLIISSVPGLNISLAKSLSDLSDCFGPCGKGHTSSSVNTWYHCYTQILCSLVRGWGGGVVERPCSSLCRCLCWSIPPLPRRPCCSNARCRAPRIMCLQCPQNARSPRHKAVTSKGLPSLATAMWNTPTWPWLLVTSPEPFP